MEKSQRIVYIDTMKTLACFLVVFTHSTMPSATGEDGFWIFLITFIAYPSPELFFTISGSLLLPAKINAIDFYKKRFLRLLPPVVIWSVINTIVLFLINDITAAESIKRLLMIPIQPVIGVYWFIYVIIGLYLFTPIISKWIITASKKELEIFLSIWIINLCMPYLNMLIPGIYNINGSYFWMLNNFGGFLGFFVMGYYLKTYPINIGLNKRFCIITLAAIAYIGMTLYIKLKNLNDSILLENLQIGCAIMCVIIFVIVQHIKINNKYILNFITEISKFSYGIYLIHFVIIRKFVWHIFENNRSFALTETLAIACLSMIISYIILKLISKLPYSKYTVGA